MLSKYVRKDKQFVLNFAAILGVGMTMISTIKDTSKACKMVDEDMTLKEKVKVSWKCYIPSGLIAASTIACIMYSDYTTMNQKISLINALGVAQTNYNNLRDSVEKNCDQDTRDAIMKDTIRKNVPKDLYIERTEDKIFYDEYRGGFFSSTIDNVLKAEYLFNKQLSIVGSATLNDFYNILGISETDLGNYVGWIAENECYRLVDASPWVDFIHYKMMDDGGNEFYNISFNNNPEVVKGYN